MPVVDAAIFAGIFSAVGALILLIGWSGGWRMRGAANDPDGEQAKANAKDADKENRLLRRQISASGEATTRLWVDPRTPEWIKIYLERELIPRLTQRSDR